MFKLGNRSTANLARCNEALQRVARRAISYGVFDFSVIEGHRTLARQQQLYAEGKTQIDGVTQKGKHNEEPSEAMDLLPYPHELNGINVWADRQRFSVLAGLIYAAAAEEGVNIRWGGDWDGDGNNVDSSFNDLPHFELLD